MRNFGAAPAGTLATREAQAPYKKGSPAQGLRGIRARLKAKERERKRKQVIARRKRYQEKFFPGQGWMRPTETGEYTPSPIPGDVGVGAGASGPSETFSESQTISEEYIEEPTFFEMYRTPIIVAGVLTLAGGGYYFAKKKGLI
jgi:hypothetical protein